MGELEKRGFNRDFNISDTRKTTAISIIIENIFYSEKFFKSEMMLQ